MNNIVREYVKTTGKKIRRKTTYLEIECNECGTHYDTAKCDHKRAMHQFLCKPCSKAMRRHKDSNGKPLPQTKEKIQIQVSWDRMIERTTNPKHHAYKNYGGKGVKIEFKSFGEFYEWSIDNGYKIGLTIDRINNDDNYKPSNCKWSTRLEQAQNRSSRPNKHKLAGIKKRGKRFMSSVTYDKKEHYCGTFDTPEEAHQAYLNKKAELTKETL